MNVTKLLNLIEEGVYRTGQTLPTLSGTLYLFDYHEGGDKDSRQGGYICTGEDKLSITFWGWPAFPEKTEIEIKLKSVEGSKGIHGITLKEYKGSPQISVSKSAETDRPRLDSDGEPIPAESNVKPEPIQTGYIDPMYGFSHKGKQLAILRQNALAHATQIQLAIYKELEDKSGITADDLTNQIIGIATEIVDWTSLFDKMDRDEKHSYIKDWLDGHEHASEIILDAKKELGIDKDAEVEDLDAFFRALKRNVKSF